MGEGTLMLLLLFQVSLVEDQLSLAQSEIK